MVKTQKIILSGHGEYLGIEEGKFIVRNNNRNTRVEYPMSECDIGEVVLRSGNCVSVGTLCSLAFWRIDCLLLTQKGRPIAYLKCLDDDSHVHTRICQYQSLENGKGIEVAKAIVKGKLEGQNLLLKKHGLEPHEPFDINSLEGKNLCTLRRKLIGIEGRHTKEYFSRIFTLFPKKLRPANRKTHHAYDGINNTLNLAYSLLKWKCHVMILKAKLEPFMGYVHSEQFGKPSLVCDFQELFRHLIDDYVIGFSQTLGKKDFIKRTEPISHNRLGKREYLNKVKTNELIEGLYNYFEKKIEIPRVKWGKRQTIESLIGEEAMLLASYIRNERKTWQPRTNLFN